MPSLRDDILDTLGEHGELAGLKLRARVADKRGWWGRLVLGFNWRLTLDDLEAEGKLVRREEPGGPERGHCPRGFYRLP